MPYNFPKRVKLPITQTRISFSLQKVKIHFKGCYLTVFECELLVNHSIHAHFKTLQKATSERVDHDMENTGLICELKTQANIRVFERLHNRYGNLRRHENHDISQDRLVKAQVL